MPAGGAGCARSPRPATHSRPHERNRDQRQRFAERHDDRKHGDDDERHAEPDGALDESAEEQSGNRDGKGERLHGGPLRKPVTAFGRSGRIRTCDPHTPSVMRYQTALRSDAANIPAPPLCAQAGGRAGQRCRMFPVGAGRRWVRADLGLDTRNGALRCSRGGRRPKPVRRSARRHSPKGITYGSGLWPQAWCGSSCFPGSSGKPVRLRVTTTSVRDQIQRTKPHTGPRSDVRQQRHGSAGADASVAGAKRSRPR